MADQEARPNLSCVAFALRDSARRPVAALSISGPTQGFDTSRNAALLRTVSAEAEHLLRCHPAPGGQPGAGSVPGRTAQLGTPRPLAVS
jgi:hypothetical protein